LQFLQEQCSRINKQAYWSTRTILEDIAWFLAKKLVSISEKLHCAKCTWFFSHLELEAIHKSFKVQAQYEKKTH